MSKGPRFESLKKNFAKNRDGKRFFIFISKKVTGSQLPVIEAEQEGLQVT